MKEKIPVQTKVTIKHKRNNEDNWVKRLPNLSYHGIFSKTYHVLCENRVQKFFHLYLEIWTDLGFEYWNRIEWDNWRGNSLLSLTFCMARNRRSLSLAIQELLNGLITDHFNFCLSVFTTVTFGILCGSVSNNLNIGKRLKE